ncbi:hypothetical protein M153_27100001030 [Pseudoloma neurophilia]|uniref:Uncharacterized protein n=1 Tax=Pseudoloma neurophilia TaxID=146866 RepID=A0A0R0LTL2_9MICR|nr:hypothetical protein M153_27100001030 [Pseudoloma neurophilia]
MNIFFNLVFPRNDEIAKLISFFEDCEDVSQIQWLVRNNLKKDSVLCLSCGVAMAMKKTKDTKIGFNWHCLNFLYLKYRKASYLKVFFFESFKCVRSTLTAKIHLSQDVKVEKVAILSILSKNTI